MDNIKLEAFDIFAYLLPGSVFLGALAIFNWAWFYHIYFIFLHDGVITWIILLFIVYTLGYIAQGIGEFIVKCLENIVKCCKNKNSNNGEEKKCFFECCLPSKVSDELTKLAIKKFKQMLKSCNNTINEDNIYNICVAFIEQRGSSKSRKILQSMQGMSLGLAVSFSILTFSLILRCQLIVALLSLFFSIVAFYRYKLFDRYRQRDAILSFLALSAKLENEH